eukprot:1311699-Prorocentrum_lima.AAC.1
MTLIHTSSLFATKSLQVSLWAQSSVARKHTPSRLIVAWYPTSCITFAMKMFQARGEKGQPWRRPLFTVYSVDSIGPYAAVHLAGYAMALHVVLTRSGCSQDKASS